jgi:geranylgeranyl diphosphate synthase type II
MPEIQTTADFETTFSNDVADIEVNMGKYLNATKIEPTLRDAVMYSIDAGGKRLRPLMTLWSCCAAGGDPKIAMPAACAIEMIHTYSLIHDDLPAMDNDNLRRGKPTNHKVFGEAIALLAGDALLTYAFSTVASQIRDSKVAQKIVIALGEAAGANGMIGGQAADILNEHNPNHSITLVKYIHLHKTAKMFEATGRMGAICADGDEATINRLGTYGLKLGLAFQIIDDLLDLTSTPEKMGKETQKDRDAGKLTYPGIISIAQAKKDADTLLNEALNAIDGLNEHGDLLRQLALKLANRTS